MSGLTNIKKGNYIIGKPVRSDLGNWGRWDSYIPTRKREYIHTAGADDVSALYHHWLEGNYNPGCSCCYLGHAHSINRHNKNIGSIE